MEENSLEIKEEIRGLITIRDGLLHEVNELRKRRKDLINYEDKIVELKAEHGKIIVEIGVATSERNGIINELGSLQKKKEIIEDEIIQFKNEILKVAGSKEFKEGEYGDFVKKIGESINEQRKEIEKNKEIIENQISTIKGNERAILLISDKTQELQRLDFEIEDKKKELLQIVSSCDERIKVAEKKESELIIKEKEVQDKIGYEGKLYALIVKNLGIFWVYAKNLQKYYDDHGIKLNVLAGLDIPTGLEEIK